MNCFRIRFCVCQRHSVAKNMDVFVGICLFVGGFVCQHDNFRTSKHRMMKLGGRCIAKRSRPSSNLGVIAPAGVRNPQNVAFFSVAQLRRMMQNVNKDMRAGETSHRTQLAHSTCLQLRRWVNHRRLSSLCCY